MSYICDHRPLRVNCITLMVERKLIVAVSGRKQRLFRFSNWLNSISYPTVLLRQLKPNVGISLADILELLKAKFELSKSLYSAELHTCKHDKTGQKAIEIILDFYLGLPQFRSWSCMVTEGLISLIG